MIHDAKVEVKLSGGLAEGTDGKERGGEGRRILQTKLSHTRKISKRLKKV